MKFLTDHSINIQNVATGEERNTLLHWHMYPATELNMAPPEPKFIYEDTPGVDGSLDVTEDTADRVLYNDRNGEWEFYITNKPLDVPNIDDTISWAQMQSDLSNFLHGQKVKITLADDPNYYYLGRLNISGFDPNKHYQHVTIEYQVEPYKYEHDEYDSGTRTVSTTDSVTAAGSPMAVIPTITINSDKFAFHQHNALTRAEAIYMLYNLSAAVSSSHTHWPVTITESKFLDVDSDEYYYDAVLWAEEYNITSGVTENIFAGNNVCTRAMFVTMLFAFNWSGRTPSVVSGNAYFSDVPVYSYYFNPVKWAYLEGYVSGDGNGHFMPNDSIKRETACAILYKYMDEPGYPSSVEDDFIDLEGEVVIAPWYYVAVVKLFNEGIVTGYSDDTFKPGNYITRGQFVTMLYAAAGKPSMGTVTIPFTDVTDDMYCYDAVRYCYDNGMISGTSETTFSPERSMLRKEMIQVLFKFGNYQAIDNDNLEYFDPDGDEDSDATAASGIVAATDVPNTAYYYNAVIWGVMYGITTLNPGHMFYPDQKATRAMAAQMLYKLLKILNNWEDDTAATIQPTQQTTTTYTYYTGSWTNGYYDSSAGDFVSSTYYKRTSYISLSGVTAIRVMCHPMNQWKISWFSSQSTSALSDETVWTYGSGGYQAVSKPRGASYAIVNIQGITGHEEDWADVVTVRPWSTGYYQSDGTYTSSNAHITSPVGDLTGVSTFRITLNAGQGTSTTTDYEGSWYNGYYNNGSFVSDDYYRRTGYINVTSATAVRVMCNALNRYQVAWFSSQSVSSAISDTGFSYGSGSFKTVTKPSGAKYAVVSIQGMTSHSEDWRDVVTARQWSVGHIGSDGTIDSSDTTSIYSPATDLTGVTRITFNNTDSAYSACAFIYNSSGTLINQVGWYSYSGSHTVTSSDLAGGATIRFCLSQDSGTISQSAKNTLTITAYTEGSAPVTSDMAVQTAVVQVPEYSFEMVYFDASNNLLSIDGWHSPGTDVPYTDDFTVPANSATVRFSMKNDSGSAIPSSAKELLEITAITTRQPPVASAMSVQTAATVTEQKVVTDITKWTVDYTDAILSCYDQDVIDDPMLDKAPMKVTLENSKGTKSTVVEEKDSAVPELVVVDGENEFTVEGDGTYRIQFKRGSL